MARDILMPQMGYDMKEGTIVRWVKRVGDRVHKGDIVAEIETDKATVEIEAFDSGTLLRVVAEPGQTVPVGQPIATLGEAGEALPEAPAATAVPPGTTAESPGITAAPPETTSVPPPTTAAPPAPARGGPSVPPARRDAAASASTPGLGTTPSAPTSATPRGSRPTAAQPAAPTVPRPSTPVAGSAPAYEDGQIRASPLARRLAAELGVDLGTVSGSGPGGRIVREDVEAAAGMGSTPSPEGTAGSADAPAGATSPGPVAGTAESPRGTGTAAGPLPEGAEDIQPSRLRQTVARRMSESKRSAPHFYVSVEIEADALLAARKELASGGTRVSVNDFLLRAAALAAVEHPEVNTAYLDGTLRRFSRVDVGMAVATDNGLLSPALLDCASKSLQQIATESADLAQRARSGHLRPEEYGGGTLTVSNLGMFGIDQFLAIINPPQALIISVGAASDRVVARAGKPAVAKVMTAWAAADHRVLDGADVARYMATFRELLEDPSRLIS